MNPKARIFSLLVIAVAALSGCSSKPAGSEAKKAETAPHKIQGKAQVLEEPGGATEAAMNAGGKSVYLWEGTHRYRLFLRTPVEIVHGKEYVAEGVDAQKVIDELGDPDQGKNGYPLRSSCERAVKMAWTSLAFDAVEGEVLRARVKRYPARSVFLVTRIRPVEDGAASAESKKDAAADAKNIPEVTVPAAKQRALLVEGSTVQTAPLWEPAGATVNCKVVIDPEGKISDLESGAQLCESVQWSQFRFQPTVQSGRPVKVNTEIEMRFEPRK